MYIDLGAEQLIAAEKHGEKIAVEIKSFVAVSVLYEFHLAIGQYRTISSHSYRKTQSECST